MIHLASVFHHTQTILRKLVADFNLSILMTLQIKLLKRLCFKKNIAKQSQKNVQLVNLKIFKILRGCEGNH